ncbi:hypothetical protein VE04_00294 [Pseudogymnoascus sp. 24MN13]|nr:hypothetical protein VE04_00294 [Pseudogymnoascus sp. 24MN13]
MFSSSLRKRPQWESVPSNLLSIPAPQWQEKTLNTHDIDVPVYGSGGHDQRMRFLLLSASDLDTQEEAVERVERLSLFNEGQHVGIVFLLKEKDGKNGFTAYIKLQTILLDLRLEVSIIPLNSLRALSTAIFVCQRQLLQAKPIIALVSPVTILPHCAARAQLLEHTRNVLSDMFHGFSELAAAATTADGQNAIKEYVPDKGQAEQAIEFWLSEYVVE